MMRNRPKKQNISFLQVIAGLMDEKNIFPAAYLHQLSDLEGANLENLRSVWSQISPQRRISLMADLQELTEDDTLVSFDNVAKMALKDSEPRVRAMAIRLLWENKDPAFVPVYMDSLRSDPDTGVRAAAASALGSYIYLGEVEEIPEQQLHEIENQLIQVVNSGEDALVQQRALESLGFSGRKEVTELIRKAYNSEDPEWVSTALFAMGRSADSAWAPEVNRMLRHRNTKVQVQAIRAAGDLELDSSRRVLLQLLDNELEDSEVRMAAIWSLSQIGGDEVRETLENVLEESEDEEEIEVLQDALDNLSFTEDTGLYGLFDFLGQSEEIDDNLTGLEDKDQSGAGAEDDLESDSGRPQGNRRHRPRK